MRTFGFPEFLFILEAAKWTIALSMIAFAGGAVGGLLVALPAPEAEAALGELLAGPAPHAAIIGHVGGATPGPTRITVR